LEASGRRRCPIDVFRYLDYRAFLADFYRAKKRRGFSYRAFSRAAGLGAPNYLKLVIAGQRNLTPAMAARFAAARSLQGEAAEYFERLVEFNQGKPGDARNAQYQRLGVFRRYRQAEKLELARAAYHSTWYLPALRELCASPAFRKGPAAKAGPYGPYLLSSSSGQSLSPSPRQIRTRRFPPSGSSAVVTRGYGPPQMRTAIRGCGSAKCARPIRSKHSST
jgi:hypothetical protein